LTIVYTWEDPKIYQKPHVYRLYFERAPAVSSKGALVSYALEEGCDAGDPIEKQSIVPPKQTIKKRMRIQQRRGGDYEYQLTYRARRRRFSARDRLRRGAPFVRDVRYGQERRVSRRRFRMEMAEPARPLHRRHRQGAGRRPADSRQMGCRRRFGQHHVAAGLDAHE